jgi:hypothetical protein
MRALVSAGEGIGDIIRITPLIRALNLLGFVVDVLLVPDYFETVGLLKGAPEIRSLFHVPSEWSKSRECHLGDLNEQYYDLAVFTTFTVHWKHLVRSRNYQVFKEEWSSQGPCQAAHEVAKTFGWSGPMPAPFAMASRRDFQLAPGTLAIHPGCKPNWPWKKWHGFPQLAALFDNVAVIGTQSDTNAEGTYFARFPEWPPHVRMFVGELSLLDTAAVISQCSALISNDSGVMHLGVALGRLTFGIFGITNPSREAIPAVNMFPVSKSLECEPKCRSLPPGRRNCEFDLLCLRTLTPLEVMRRLCDHCPEIPRRQGIL